MPVVNDAAIDLICESEGFVDHWYPDPAHGWKVPTCCYGHTDAAGEPKYAKTKGHKFTAAEGRAILAKDLDAVSRSVLAAVAVPLTDNQFGALVSFTYNLGAANLKKSTLLKKLNAKDYAGATGEFERWVNAGGKKLPGLVKRRAAEAALFSSGTDTPVTPETPPTGLAGVLAALLTLIVKLFTRKDR